MRALSVLKIRNKYRLLKCEFSACCHFGCDDALWLPSLSLPSPWTTCERRPYDVIRSKMAPTGKFKHQNGWYLFPIFDTLWCFLPIYFQLIFSLIRENFVIQLIMEISEIKLRHFEAILTPLYIHHYSLSPYI